MAYSSKIDTISPDRVSAGYTITCYSSDFVLGNDDESNILTASRCRITNQATGTFYGADMIGSFDKENKSFVVKTPSEAENGQYAIVAIFSSVNNEYRLDSMGGILTIMGGAEPGDSVVLQGIYPQSVTVEDATNIFFNIRGSHLNKAENFTLTKVTGSGPMLIPIRVTGSSPIAAKFRLVAPVSRIKSGRYRLSVVDRNTRDLVTCPIQLKITDNG